MHFKPSLTLYFSFCII